MGLPICIVTIGMNHQGRNHKSMGFLRDENEATAEPFSMR
jgi:hypothetical protein